MGALGFIDATRGRTIAFRLLAKEFDRNWSNLKKEAEPLGAKTVESAAQHDPNEGPVSFKSVADLKKSGRISGSKLVLLMVLLLLVALLSAYLKGLSRGHGF
jgi:hypothetical protein